MGPVTLVGPHKDALKAENSDQNLKTNQFFLEHCKLQTAT